MSRFVVRRSRFRHVYGEAHGRARYNNLRVATGMRIFFLIRA